ncbi:MAG TPA: 7-cyano-7-deazaguanine synthase QueC [Acidiphilium sp.]|nr:MAG: 7-cyano-7-deazaguanine synthase QueC [Acidiphilium sp. 21-60-14]OYV91316.1 MAG: 7-cyano-7-deazaguanine synthase QueC [Acidiphilium sp. 37-60-79]OZB40779.1 MAG: 7-cyano-7-deazaguanine synthase QueC [Acidiphilium sp. 34-60-192]HQT88852.1 7-cyano-7-deazaguanine synthase QueC [Acidiphilium sp.]HQU23758.1 7-cyano-7-deazaguanine synthase QueC [Acidiphilium sp.]
MPHQNPPPHATAALVLFSGGQDSATCLADALARYQRVETIGFFYGQRHEIEIDCRAPLRSAIAAASPFGDRLGADHMLNIEPALTALGATAMTSAMEITVTESGLPSTFVPGRNLLFLTYAAALAYRRDLHALVGGMCETDYSGYPDCRATTMAAMQSALTLGLDRPILIDTPLMGLDKAATWRLAERLGGPAMIEAIRVLSHSCYRGDRSHLHGWGYGCDDCPACALRKSGWMRYRNSSNAEAGQ